MSAQPEKETALEQLDILLDITHDALSQAYRHCVVNNIDHKYIRTAEKALEELSDIIQHDLNIIYTKDVNGTLRVKGISTTLINNEEKA